jgi:hypothetical protein
LRGFSESLRAELSDQPHIHVCEVYPTFVDTPGMSHGANYSGGQVRPPPPVVDPRTVANALVSLATRPAPAPTSARPRGRAFWRTPGAEPGGAQHEMAHRQVAAARSTRGTNRRQSVQPSLGTAIDGGFRSTPALNPAAVAFGAAAAGFGALALAGAWARQHRRSA